MMRELKEGDRLVDTDGDTGVAHGVRVNGTDDVRFDMVYDKGFVVENMLYTPITDDPVDLGFKHVEDPGPPTQKGRVDE